MNTRVQGIHEVLGILQNATVFEFLIFGGFTKEYVKSPWNVLGFLKKDQTSVS